MRKPSRKGLIKKIDKVAKEIMYLKHGKACVQCGSANRIGWGHVFSCRTYSTRWDLWNIHPQCWPCNFRHVRDQYPYFRWFQGRYGMEEFDELRRRFKKTKRWTRLDLEDQLKLLIKVLEELNE